MYDIRSTKIFYGFRFLCGYKDSIDRRLIENEEGNEGRKSFWLAIKRSRKNKTFLITWSHGIMMLQKRIKIDAS